MKKSELAFAAILVPFDFLMIALAAIVIYFLRFTPQVVGVRPIQFNLPFEHYLLLILVVVPFWLVIFALLGLYNLKKPRRLVDDIYGAFTGISTGVMGIVMFIFLRAELFSSRFLVVGTWILSIVFVVIGRSLIRFTQRQLYKYGYGVHRVVLIGDTSAARHINKGCQKSHSGFNIVGRIGDINGSTLKSLKQISEERGIDEIIQTDPVVSKTKMLDLIDFADDRKIDMKYIPDMFGTEATNIEVRAISGLPVVELRRTRSKF